MLEAWACRAGVSCEDALSLSTTARDSRATRRVLKVPDRVAVLDECFAACRDDARDAAAAPPSPRAPAVAAAAAGGEVLTLDECIAAAKAQFDLTDWR